MSYGSKLIERAAIAAKEAIDLGASRLEAQMVFEIARMPGVNYQTAGTIIEAINLRTGSKHHVGSGRRCVANLARKGIIAKRRVMPGHKPRGAKSVFYHGTTEKEFLWKPNDLKDPIPQHELARMRKEARRMSKYSQQEPAPTTPVVTGPKHASTPAILPDLPKLSAREREFYDEFEAMAASTIAIEKEREHRVSPRQRREDQSMLDSIRRTRDGPPK